MTASVITIMFLLSVAAVYTIFAGARSDMPWSRTRLGALLLLRLCVLAALAAWLLDLEFTSEHTTKRVELVIVADRSPSIDSKSRRAMDGLIAEAKTSAALADGSVAVVDFGAGERGPSGIAEAMEAGRAKFTNRGEKRLLLLSDGRATGRNPLRRAARLKREGIKVYAVALAPLEGEALIGGLNVPPAAWRSAPVPVEIHLRASLPAPTTCALSLLIDGKQKERRDVRVGSGLTVVTMTATFEETGIHRMDLQASFGRDRFDWNNRVTSLIDIRPAPRVMVISSTPAKLHPLKKALEANAIPVEVVIPERLPAKLSCDCIVLENVPAKALGNERLQMIENFVRAGGAIVFTGGPQAYGAGAYRNTPVEPAFPLLLEPEKEYPPFALAVVLDNSWSMNEGLSSSVGKIEVAKEIAIAALECLNKDDWLTLISFDSDYHEIIAPVKVEDLEPLKYEISRIGAFGMTNIYGGLEMGIRKLRLIDAAYKHVVLISDGKETETADYTVLLKDLAKSRITLSAIAVGRGANKKLLNTLAFAGRGRFYHTESLKEIPAVVLQEAKGLKSQIIMEQPLPAKKLEEDPAIIGIEVEELPRLLGYNRTRARRHAWTPLVISSKNEPLLARMRYGMGQAVAFTSSATSVWARDWIEKSPKTYAAFWRQVVLSALRTPYTEWKPAVDYRDGRPVLRFTVSTPHKVSVHRLLAGEVKTETAAETPLRLEADEASATLLVTETKFGQAFAWNRSYGREFGDAEEGVGVLEGLCHFTGGVFQPKMTDLFSDGKAIVYSQMNRSAWLIAALVLLLAELLLRRMAAVARIFRRRNREPSRNAMGAIEPVELRIQGN
ncbi:MAG: hypothetical protein AMK72_05910 [Planctomycetes bacterium SM23_25]|nr:MAG: hypothetical protein AMK72_05910 [Planctomycetes bacterium SM23_25]